MMIAMTMRSVVMVPTTTKCLKGATSTRITDTMMEIAMLMNKEEDK